MKETGVSRRIDELGRIVIPKEIRKNLKIREGDQMEFYVEKEYVVLRKKSSLQGLDEDIEHLLEVLYKKINKVILLTDLDKVIYVKGDDKYKDLDLSTCNISDMALDINHIKGLIVSYDQAATISTILGIKIKN